MGRAQGEMAKANYTNALARQVDQEYMDNVMGITHNRNMELQGAQAKAQAEKAMQELGMKYAMESRKADQKDEELRLKNQENLLRHRDEMAKIRNQAKKKKGSL